MKKFSPLGLLKDLEITDVACGDYHTICLTKDGELISWGGALNKKLFKRPSIRESSVESQVIRPLVGKQIMMISCGDFHTMALDSFG